MTTGRRASLNYMEASSVQHCGRRYVHDISQLTDGGNSLATNEMAENLIYITKVGSHFYRVTLC